MSDMLTCPRCGRRESKDEDYHVLCSECYEFFVGWHGSTEDTVPFYRAWGKFIDEWDKADRDLVMDFTECGEFWGFLDEAFHQADFDIRYNWLKKQIERMKE